MEIHVNVTGGQISKWIFDYMCKKKDTIQTKLMGDFYVNGEVSTVNGIKSWYAIIDESFAKNKNFYKFVLKDPQIKRLPRPHKRQVLEIVYDALNASGRGVVGTVRDNLKAFFAHYVSKTATTPAPGASEVLGVAERLDQICDPTVSTWRSDTKNLLVSTVSAGKAYASKFNFWTFLKTRKKLIANVAMLANARKVLYYLFDSGQYGQLAGAALAWATFNIVISGGEKLLEWRKNREGANKQIHKHNAIVSQFSNANLLLEGNIPSRTVKGLQDALGGQWETDEKERKDFSQGILPVTDSELEMRFKKLKGKEDVVIEVKQEDPVGLPDVPSGPVLPEPGRGSFNKKRKNKAAKSYLAQEMKKQEEYRDHVLRNVIGVQITSALNLQQLETLKNWIGECLEIYVDIIQTPGAKTAFEKQIISMMPSKDKCIRRIQFLRMATQQALLYMFTPTDHVEKLFYTNNPMSVSIQNQLQDGQKLGMAMMILTPTPGNVRLVGLKANGEHVKVDFPAEELCEAVGDKPCNLMELIFAKYGVYLLQNERWMDQLGLSSTLEAKMETMRPNSKKSNDFARRSQIFAALVNTMQEQGIIGKDYVVPKYFDSDKIIQADFNKRVKQIVTRYHDMNKVLADLTLHDNVNQVFATEHITENVTKERFINKSEPADYLFVDCAKAFGIGNEIGVYYDICNRFIKDVLKNKNRITTDLFHLDKKGRIVPSCKSEFVRVNTLMAQPVLISFMMPMGKSCEWITVVGDLWQLYAVIHQLQTHRVPLLIMEIHELKKQLVSMLKNYNVQYEMFRDVLYTRFWPELIV